MLSSEDKARLLETAKDLRLDIIDTMGYAGGAHAGGSMSMLDILTVLYFKPYLNVDPENPEWADRDRFILSKGHCALGYIPTLMKRGFMDKEGLKTFNHTGSAFGMHPDSNKIPGCDASTGSLGHGLPMAVGMAIGAKLQKKDYRVVCLLGDGECDEGSNWEASMTANHYKLNNLIVIVDRNHFMIDGNTEDVMKLEPLADKFKAFGYNVIKINGHDLDQIDDALATAWKATDGPTLILADTIKGKTLPAPLAGDVKCHYCSLDSEQLAAGRANIIAQYEADKANLGK